MLDKIKDFALKYNMIPKGSVVICGLSGGADSVCLTVCLSRLAPLLGFSVEALHVNHCIRGDEADRDEEFCRQLCQKLGIPFHSVSCDVPAFAESRHLSVEEAARIMRYDAFNKASDDGKLIATAHNANDNLETIILNLTRGSALKGISGIPPVRDNIVRPLLGVTRQEIEDFLLAENISYVTDSTNLSDNYTRNKIRHKILPLMCGINPSVVRTSVGSADALREEEDLISQLTADALKLCRNGNTLSDYSTLHTVVRKRCIAALLTDNCIPYSHERLNALDCIAINGGKFNLSGDSYFVSDGQTAELKCIPRKSDQPVLKTDLIIGENSIFKGKTLRAEIISDENFKINKYVNIDAAEYFLDCDKLVGKLVLHSRQFGDRIMLYGRDFTSSVKKLINGKVSSDLRSELLFISDAEGLVFAEMIGIASRAAPDSSTVNWLKLTVSSDHINSI